MKNLLITGVSGKVGSSLAQNIRSGKFIGIYHRRVPAKSKNGLYFQRDLSEGLALTSRINARINTVIHCAAVTHIDKCEKDKINGKGGMVWRSNVEATRQVIKYCKSERKKLVFLSTECVFDGEKESYTEDDMPNPKNWYGTTKHEAERLITNSNIEYLIIRGVLAYGREKELDDVFQKMYNRLDLNGELVAVNDQRLNPTYVGDIVDSIFELLDRNSQGIYHVSGSSIVTPYQIGIYLAALLNLNKKSVKGIPMKEYFSEDKYKLRLKNSVLSNYKYFKETGKRTKTIEEGLNLLFNKKK